jgi:hypothetical protein
MFSKENQPDRTNKPKGGRPKGSKDKKFLTLQFWYDRLETDWKKLKPAQRAKLSVQLMQMLTNKLKELPGSPQDSLLNANEALSRLKLLEQGVVKKSEASQTKHSDASLPQQNPKGL